MKGHNDVNRCKRFLLVSLSMLLLGVLVGPVRADLVISGSSVQLNSGQTGTMDFNIRSTTGTDQLQSFNVELLITRVGGTTSLLQFTDTQPDPYGNGNYVFAGDSFGGINGVPFWGAPSATGTNYPKDTISGGDMTNSGTAVTVPTASFGPGTYLTTVQFQAPLNASPGDTFSISLVTDPMQTFFKDAGGGTINYTSSPGTVLILGATPEPSSLVLGATAGVGGLFIFWRKRRGAKPVMESLN